MAALLPMYTDMKQSTLSKPRPSEPHVAKLRRCLMCHDSFKSSWPGERVCKRRSEEHTSELQSLMRISYAVFCLKKKKEQTRPSHQTSLAHHYNMTLTQHNNKQHKAT